MLALLGPRWAGGAAMMREQVRELASFGRATLRESRLDLEPVQEWVGAPTRLPRALVVMPTFQEADNIQRILRCVRAALPAIEILVVDDSSPDGTAELADTVAEERGGVYVLRRPAKSGLGSAYRDGLRWGLEHGYEA